MKDKIINAGIILFDERGFTETSVQEIVDQIGVTKGTFYYYFSTKQELLKDINLLYIEDLIKQQEAILNNKDKNCTMKLHDIVYMVVSNISSKQRNARIFFREMRHLGDNHLENIKMRRNVFRENYQKMIEEGIAKGEFKDSFRPDLLTFGLLGITNWSYYWYNPDGEVNEKELSENYVNMILNGITNKPA